MGGENPEGWGIHEVGAIEAWAGAWDIVWKLRAFCLLENQGFALQAVRPISTETLKMSV